MTGGSQVGESDGHQIPFVEPGQAEGETSRVQRETQPPYDRIKAMILSKAIPPDTKLNIDKLARELGVSQTPVREALQRLEGDKLVVGKKPRGLWTSPLLDEGQLRELIEVRLLLEPWSASAAANDRASNPGREMLAEIDRFVALNERKNEGYALASHDVAFHDMIFYAVGNSFLHNAFRQLHAHLHLFRLYPADLDGTHTIEEHKVIAEAISRADPHAAEEAMRAHLFAAMDRFSLGVRGKDTLTSLGAVRSHVLGAPGSGQTNHVPAPSQSTGSDGTLGRRHD
ncbi:GntR family transcriptional regulator [Nesterenkonia salmonea]|uniref:GntR family transcriptional regulator n=1 Tax=Nesterenkonia salmonea TaxID=1804987 RepID=A0A5R9BM97_9MICC|nr:GntR family transcriptional regulator [Nesterenkonia salmonea]TLQ01071.1 GntR family transcriptional regulator [Nesterenkonia salmonea]